MMAFDPFKFMGMMAKGEQVSDRTEALREETDRYIIDTCMCYDTGKWETGIHYVGAEWVIVEDYGDSSEAKIGHDKWIAKMKELPSIKLKSIQFFDLGDDEDDNDPDEGIDDQ
jgi:hypothetical protein